MIRNPFPDNIKHIGISAPSGKVNPEAVNNAVRIIEQIGLKVTVMPGVLKNGRHPYLAADLETRLADLHCCFERDDIDLILCARGGYGCAHLLPHLNWDLLRERQLPVLGYSDITALHLGMLKYNAGLPVVSPMCKQFPEALADDLTFNALQRAFQPVAKVVLDDLKILKPGSLKAPAVPVNLTVMTSLVGTPYLPDFSGRILIVEDLNEPLYKLDRYFTQLDQAGILQACSGLVFGKFEDCGSEKERQLLFQEVAKSINGPVLAGFPFGHSMPMACLRLDTEITVDGAKISW
jgi:muramoyltetrapeptide carboxypeptidase